MRSQRDVEDPNLVIAILRPVLLGTFRTRPSSPTRTRGVKLAARECGRIWWGRSQFPNMSVRVIHEQEPRSIKVRASKPSIERFNTGVVN